MLTTPAIKATMISNGFQPTDPLDEETCRILLKYKEAGVLTQNGASALEGKLGDKTQPINEEVCKLCEQILGE